MLASFYLLVFVGLLTQQADAQCSHTNPCSFDGMGGDALVQPQEEVSSGGTLAFTLNVTMADVTVEWLTLYRRTYNGGFPGPTWRVKRGDTVTVTLVNQLSLPHKEQALNQLRLPNSTNLHTHGLHISGEEPQDDVFVHVAPGESYTYTYEICPEQPSGTYWYHPHLHGSTIFQVHSGLAGMIVVEDDTTGAAAAPDHLLAVSCPDNCVHDIQLLFQPTMQYVNNAGRGFANLQSQIEDNEMFRHAGITTSGGITLEAWLTDAANGVDYFTTNGQLFPTLDLTAGQAKRFRMVNAGGSATLELIVVDAQNGGTNTCTYMEIAVDGVYLDEARVPAQSKTFIPPSSKVDWLIVCNTPGTYELRSMPANADAQSMGGFQRYDGLLLQITVTGSAATTTLGTTLPARQSFVQDFRSLTQEQVTGRFVIEAAPGTQLNRARFSSQTDFRFKSELGTVQEWYLTNADPAVGHPIHIHVNHFQIISYNAYTGPVAIGGRGGATLYDQQGSTCFYNPLGTVTTTINLPPNTLQYLGHDVRSANYGAAGTLAYVPVGDFRDVMVVPPLANITIRFLNHKFTGKVVMHCHILNHEDTGMMMTSQIVNPGESLATTHDVSLGHPGTCRICDPYPFNGDRASCLLQWLIALSSSSAPHISSFLFYLCLLFVVYKIIDAVDGKYDTKKKEEKKKQKVLVK